MAKRTRIFLLAAAGILVVGLTAGLVAWAIRVPVLAALSADAPEELSYVPDTARMVAYADMRQLMRSEFRGKLRQLQPGAAPNANGLEARTGINVEEDIDRVLVASSGFTTGADRKDDSLLVARGRFDAARIEGLLRGQGAQVEQYRGKRLLSLKDASSDVALAFAETGLVLFGNGQLVRSAVDAKSGAGGDISANKEFMGFVGKVQDGTAWTVAKVDSLAGSAALPPEVANSLPPITWLVASGRLDSSLHGLVQAEALDERSAQNLRDVVQGFLALARLQVSRRPELRGALDSIALSSEGKSVSLSFEVTPGLLDLLSSGNTLPRPVTPPRPRSPQGAPQVF